MYSVQILTDNVPPIRKEWGVPLFKESEQRNDSQAQTPRGIYPSRSF